MANLPGLPHCHTSCTCKPGGLLSIIAQSAVRHPSHPCTPCSPRAPRTRAVPAGPPCRPAPPPGWRSAASPRPPAGPHSCGLNKEVRCGELRNGRKPVQLSSRQFATKTKHRNSSRMPAQAQHAGGSNNNCMQSWKSQPETSRRWSQQLQHSRLTGSAGSLGNQPPGPSPWP